ncbi:unnamed protein product, partial [Acidithrix sp. C25]|jgi:SAM-dependent methyltransferase
VTFAIPYQLRDDLYKSPLLRALQHLRDMTGFSCVDVGAGGGDVSIALAELCGQNGRIYAVDIDPVRRNEIATHAAQFSQVIALTQAAQELTLPEQVDLAYCRFLLLAVPEPKIVISRMIKATKKGGWVILQEPITSCGRVGRLPLSMDSDFVVDPDIGASLLELLVDQDLEVKDAWIEAPVGIGPGAVSSYLEALTDTEVLDEQIVLPPVVTVVGRVNR